MMGRLISIDKVRPDAQWYFDDAYFNSGGHGSYMFEWPNKTFPHQLSIHKNDIDNLNMKPKIRRWIENTISDTVIFDYLNMDYKKYYGKSYEWDKYFIIYNSWYRFHFENVHSASMFALTFSEVIKPLTKWHPDTPEDEEYLNRPEEERYIK